MAGLFRNESQGLALPRREAEPTFELRPDGGLTKQQVDELRAALRELGLDDEVQSL
jgi:hypothetical protein